MIRNCLTIIALIFVAINIKCAYEAKKQTLKVSLYYETLCPFCMAFINEQLYPGYQKIGDYLDLELIPYGNAKRNKSNDAWIIECQHGPKECLYNKIEACGLARNEDQNVSISFVYCIQKAIQMDPSANYKLITKKCSGIIGVSSTEIIKCAEGEEGDELMVKNGVKTDAVQPEIQGVPTVLYNDYYNDTLEEYNDNFLGIACKLLNDEPNACTNLENEIL